MFESWLFGIVLAAVIGILLALFIHIVVFIYIHGLIAYVGFNHIKYHKDYVPKREIINATRLYKSIFTRKPVEFL